MISKLVIILLLVNFITAAVNPNDVTFRLYTRNNPDTYILLDLENLQNANIDVSLPFKFIIHGYLSSADTAWMLEMKDSFLLKDNYNVVLTDWSIPAAELYPIAATNAEEVGAILAKLIINLNVVLDISYENIHAYGHSLGAHIAGFAGKDIKNTNGELIDRITAMDPAGPLFYGQPPDQRLSVGDAVFIDAIHSDNLKFGYIDPIGNVDFFPNGGTCPHSGCVTKRKRDLEDTMSVSCCHSMARIYANEAINSKNFISTKCGSYTNYLMSLCRFNQQTSMGEYVSRTATGSYFLNTNAQTPYAQG